MNKTRKEWEATLKSGVIWDGDIPLALKDIAELWQRIELLEGIVMNWVDPFAVPDEVKKVSDELWAAEHARQALQGDTE